MQFEKEDIVKFQNFCQKVIDKPRGFNEQMVKKENGFIWCEDWRIIEILKYLFNGEAMYLSDPPPNRLKNNPLWSKEEIIKDAGMLIDILKTSDFIIRFLTELREGKYARVDDAVKTA